ncbi:MAG TPA: trehalase family glycosidase, partial [Dehalococcoidia bacterium]|nr:trehalase family glycosidase [Dehalococcoidia bacterium]
EVYAAYEPLRGDDRRILAADIFHIEDVLVNSIYAFGLRSLVRLLGDGPEATEFSREADRTLAALLAKCWDEDAGAFFDLSGVAERPLQVVTISSLMPLVLDDLPRPVVERLVSRWVTSTDHFWLPYPMPSVPASNPKFMPGNPRGFIWRGPTWINTNWFLSHALRRHGYAELADTIVARSHQCIEKSGFREYYHPYIAEGLGARDFGWSTLILDM